MYPTDGMTPEQITAYYLRLARLRIAERKERMRMRRRARKAGVRA